VALAPSKKTNVLFLEKIAPSRVTHARVFCEDSAQRKQTKWRQKLPSLEMKKFSFCRRCHFQIWGKPLGRTFWIVALDIRIVQVIPMMAVRIFQTNPVAKMCRTCRTRISPLDGWNVLRAKKASNYQKNLKANQAGKGKRHPENIFPLRRYRDWRAATKIVKWMSKHDVKESYAHW